VRLPPLPRLQQAAAALAAALQVGSEYGFLCQQPLRLVVLQQLKGNPKLWPLPKKLAASASLALKPPPHRVPFSWAPALRARGGPRTALRWLGAGMAA
jgi:hypothetical protein